MSREDIKKIILIIGTALIITEAIFYLNQQEQKDQWSPGATAWKYRAQIHTDSEISYEYTITIHASNGTNSDTDVYCNTHCNKDFSDIRILLDDGTDIKKRILSQSNESMVVQVQIPAGKQSMAIYYSQVDVNVSDSWNRSNLNDTMLYQRDNNYQITLNTTNT